MEQQLPNPVKIHVKRHVWTHPKPGKHWKVFGQHGLGNSTIFTSAQCNTWHEAMAIASKEATRLKQIGAVRRND